MGILFAGLTLIGCKKEYYTDEVVVDSPAISNAPTDSMSFSGGWEGSLTVDSDTSVWLIADRIGHLNIDSLHEGDRVFAVLQVGLQWPNQDCMNDLHVSAGTILSQDISQTPENSEVKRFSGAMQEEAWPEDDDMKQFVRIEELAISEARTAVVLQAYVKPWTSQCSGVVPQCFITNRSLSVVIVHEH